MFIFYQEIPKLGEKFARKLAHFPRNIIEFAVFFSGKLFLRPRV